MSIFSISGKKFLRAYPLPTIHERLNPVMYRDGHIHLWPLFRLMHKPLIITHATIVPVASLLTSPLTFYDDG